MSRLTLIAGPDGAGKSTLARQAGFEGPFVNADDIAWTINPEASEAVALAAGRETLAQLAALIHERRDVVYETTLSGNTALRVVDRAKTAGYTIEAVFVAVPSADLAIGRVAQRAAAGGPFVPPAAVRRRYERSFDNLPGLVARADVTTVYDNTEKNRTVVARVEGHNFTLRQLDATNDLHVRIAQAIKAGLSDRADPTRPIARQTHGRARAPSRNDAIASARGDASETLAPETTRTVPPDVLALVNALTQAAHALNGALQGAQQGQGRPARQQTDGPKRHSEARPARDLLPSRQLDRILSAEEICKRAASDPRLRKYRAAVEAAAEAAFKKPGPIVEALSRQAIEKPETIAAVRRQLYEKPQDLGDLRGGTTRYLRREDEERQAARSAAQWVALGLTDLAGAAQSIKAEIVGEWASFVQREQIGIPEPSEQLQAVLAEGPMTQAALAEVARNNDLVREINIFLDAAHQRFGWAGMSSIREGRVDVLRSRMAGIKEHDLERAATLTQTMLMLHDKVHDHQGHELKREVEQKRTLGPK
jgi:predicted ABC-type ATPase